MISKIASSISELHRTVGRYAVCAMFIGVGQSIAIVTKRV